MELKKTNFICMVENKDKNLLLENTLSGKKYLIKEDKKDEFDAKIISQNGEVSDIKLYISGLTDEERQILLDGCLMNYYKRKNNL